MSLTPAGADMAPISPAGVDRNTSTDVWWAVRLANGTVGLARGSSSPTMVGGSRAVAAEPIAHASSLVDLMTHDSATAIRALVNLGANARQQAAIIAQTDVGAGQSSTVASVFVTSAGRPAASTAAGADVSTTPHGDATPINQIPSPIPPTAGNSHLALPSVGGLAVRVLEAVGGVLLLVLGLRALLGGDAPTVTLARTAAKVIR